MAAAEHEGHARHRRLRAGQQHGQLARAFGAAVEAQRTRWIALADEGPVAREDQVRREGDEADTPLTAGLRHQARQPRVDALGLLGTVLAVFRAAQHRGVDDRVGTDLVEEPGDGRGIRQVGRERPRAGRRGAAAMSGCHVEAPLVEQGREATSQQPARAGDEDAQLLAQSVITAPPLTDRTWPWR